ncbi:MAG: hypothetical protein ACOYIF_12940 [Acetivibrionales bacterium]|jgi:hypothetical protein
MRRIRIRLKNKNSASTNSRDSEYSSCSVQTDETSSKVFARHLQRYKGKIVTIFTTGGGLSGLGFTGVVLDVNDAYVRLIAKPGPAPLCLWTFEKNTGPVEKVPQGNFCLAPAPFLGSEIFIPASKIVSVVHSTV